MGGEKAETSGLSGHPGLRHDGAETGGVIPALAEVRFRYVAAVLVIGLTIWGWLDVRERGQTHPNHADFHRTDFTVYTEAGAAFFDGREPYEVTNPRHWYYLYPPLFALLVSPLAALDFKSQVVVWYIISLVLAFGCYSESRHLWTLLVASDSGEADVGRNAAFRIGACAGLTVLLPTLECLQRGQVGIALVYPLLLGFRLSAGRPFVADLVPRRCRAGLADRGKAHPGVTRRSLAIATLGGGPGTVPLAAIIEPGHYCHPWLGVGRVPVHLCHPSRLYRLESEPAPSPHLEPESGNQPGHGP